jgi:hypothetical protein
MPLSLAKGLYEGKQLSIAKLEFAKRTAVCGVIGSD